MDEFLQALGLVFLIFIIVAAPIVPALVFDCQDYCIVIDAEYSDICDISMESGDAAKVWISDYTPLNASQYALILRARDQGGDNDIAKLLRGYKYQILPEGED